MAPLNYLHCSFKNKQYFFARDNKIEIVYIWNKLDDSWVPPTQYIELKPVILEDLEQEEKTSNSDSLNIQTPIDT